MEDFRSNEMGSMPVGKLLMKTALPMMVSMLVQALYNVVDSVRIGLIFRICVWNWNSRLLMR